jgi:hypothetical protein
MSAFDPKRTCSSAPHMSAFGGKADMACAAHMSASDPKRTLGSTPQPFSHSCDCFNLQQEIWIFQ